MGTLKNTFNCSQSRKIHANTAFRIPADYLPQNEPSLLSASGCAYEVGTLKKGLNNWLCPALLHALAHSEDGLEVLAVGGQLLYMLLYCLDE